MKHATSASNVIDGSNAGAAWCSKLTSRWSWSRICCAPRRLDVPVTVDGARHRYRSRPTRSGRVCRGSSLGSLVSRLLAEDPANNLLSVEDQPAEGRVA